MLPPLGLASIVGGCCPEPGRPAPGRCPPCPIAPCMACATAACTRVHTCHRSNPVLGARHSPVSGSCIVGGSPKLRSSKSSASVHGSSGNPAFLRCIQIKRRVIEFSSCKLKGTTEKLKLSLCQRALSN